MLKHEAPVCGTCYQRLYRQGTVECSEPGCTARIPPRSRRGRTVPMPWCRRHEHRALAPDMLGDEGREAVKRAVVARIVPDWATGCWRWTGGAQDGYGRYRATRQLTGEWVAHRMTWHLVNPGHGYRRELDHRHGSGYGAGALCVSPLHLQPVTARENVRLRELRRLDPAGYWFRSELDGAVPVPLLVFAWANVLPLKAPGLDYSASWEPAGASAGAGAVQAGTQGLAPVVEPEPVAIAPAGRAPAGRALSERTLRELKLSPAEAQLLAGRRRWRRRRPGRR